MQSGCNIENTKESKSMVNVKEPALDRTKEQG